MHGETEIPTLLGDLWPQLWESGYRHVAAEVSPWAADQLERATAHGTALIPGLWTVEQALTVRQFASPSQRVLWGCDIEEIQPNRLIAQLAAQNPGHSKLGQMLAITRAAYDRKQAPELSRIAQSFTPANDLRLSGVSLWESLRDTLRLEALRATPGCKLQASEAREQIMKHLFLTHYGADPEGKTFLRFGRNHLHRGYDARGISTLGNFVAEWALSHNQSVVNVGAFAAGGKEHILDSTVDVGERQDEGTFNLLANLAKDTATLFDLRPPRPIPHANPRKTRPPLEANLVYWSDTYDFLICYPKVTPLP